MWDVDIRFDDMLIEDEPDREIGYPKDSWDVTKDACIGLCDKLGWTFAIIIDLDVYDWLPRPLAADIEKCLFFNISGGIEARYFRA